MSDDFAKLIEPLARHFFGEPNRRMSTKSELRFGNHGSLSINLKKDTWFDHETGTGGGVLDLVRQQKGFTETRDAMAWLEAEGFMNGRANGHAKGGLGTEIAHYEYVDEAGSLLFQVVRYDPKDFRQRRPNGAGGWAWGVKGVRQVPYRLTELLEALSLERVVFIVEGEKDTDNLIRIGVPATCNAQGAGNWPPEINPIFAGADVVIIADNDPQQKDKAGKLLFHDDGRPKFAGQDHANHVAAQLMGVAARVRVLDLGKAWEGCPPKGDITDWIAAGGDADLLYRVVETLADWKPITPDAVVSRRPTPYTAPDPAMIPRRAWLHGGHYIRQAATATVAPGGMGKTTLTLFEAITMVAAGLHVWYLSGEDPRVEIDRRIAAHCQHHDIDIATLPGRLFVDDKTTFAMFIGTSARTASVTFDDPSLAVFEAAIVAEKIDVVLIDPFVSFHSVPENDNGAIDQVVKRLGAIAYRTNCCIEISHHVRKPFQGQATLTVDDARGGSAIINAVRSGRAINRMSSTEAEQAKIDKDRRSFYFRVDKGKRNMAPPEAAEWYQMHSVALPNGDNVQAIEPWKFPKLFAEMSTEDTDWVRDLVNRKAFKVDPRSDEWLGIPIAQRLQLDVTDKGDCKRIAKIIAVWVLNRVFKKMEMRDPIARRMKPYYVGMGATQTGAEPTPELALEPEDDDNDD